MTAAQQPRGKDITPVFLRMRKLGPQGKESKTEGFRASNCKRRNVQVKNGAEAWSPGYVDCGLEGGEWDKGSQRRGAPEENPSWGQHVLQYGWLTKGKRSGVETDGNLHWKCHFHLHFTGQNASHKAKPDVNGAGISSLLYLDTSTEGLRKEEKSRSWK